MTGYVCNRREWDFCSATLNPVVTTYKASYISVTFFLTKLCRHIVRRQYRCIHYNERDQVCRQVGLLTSIGAGLMDKSCPGYTRTVWLCSQFSGVLRLYSYFFYDLPYPKRPFPNMDLQFFRESFRLAMNKSEEMLRNYGLVWSSRSVLINPPGRPSSLGSINRRTFATLSLARYACSTCMCGSQLLPEIGYCTRMRAIGVLFSIPILYGLLLVLRTLMVALTEPDSLMQLMSLNLAMSPKRRWIFCNFFYANHPVIFANTVYSVYMTFPSYSVLLLFPPSFSTLWHPVEYIPRKVILRALFVPGDPTKRSPPNRGCLLYTSPSPRD